MPKREQKKYNIIMADPPWRYSGKCGQGVIGSSDNSSYPTMTPQALIDMQIMKKYAAKDCVLLVWATGPKMDTAIDVIRGWGFKYKTQFLTWIKVSRAGAVILGTGNYARSNAEFLLIATRGKVGHFRKAGRTRVSSVVFAKRREHSRKPDEARDVVCSVFRDDLSRIELFARQSAPGWDVMGNETTKFDRVVNNATRRVPCDLPPVTTGENNIATYFRRPTRYADEWAALEHVFS